MKSYRSMTPVGVILLLTIITLLTHACTESSLIGSDILPPDDQLNILATDTVTMFTTTTVGDSSRTYTPVSNQQLPNYLVGRLDDPIFGNSTAITFAQTRLLTTSPNFDLTTLDSIVLALPYDLGEKHYGNKDATQTIRISRLTEVMDASLEYYSNKRFAAGEILGEKTFTPNFTDSITILVPESDTVLERRVGPQLRIPLTSSFGNELLNSAGSMGSIDDYLDFFKGIEIKGGSDNDALLSFDLFNSDITLFYTQEDSLFDTDGNFLNVESVAKKFIFSINTFSAKSVYFNNNRDLVGQIRTDAPVKQYMNNMTDSLMFAQSMEGLYSQITFPYVTNFQGSIINKAELIITVANRENLEEFPLPDQLVVLSKLDDRLIVIEDVATSISTSGNFALLGGDPVDEEIDGVTYTTYSINISAHFQDMVDGFTDDNVIYLSTYPKPQVGTRVIFGGAEHSEFPIQLKLSYTEID